MIRDKSYIKTTLRDKADDGRVGEGIWEVCNASILFFWARGGGSVGGEKVTGEKRSRWRRIRGSLMWFHLYEYN